MSVFLACFYNGLVCDRFSAWSCSLKRAVYNTPDSECLDCYTIWRDDNNFTYNGQNFATAQHLDMSRWARAQQCHTAASTTWLVMQLMFVSMEQTTVPPLCRTIIQIPATPCDGNFVVCQCHAVLDPSLNSYTPISGAFFEVATQYTPRRNDACIWAT